MDKPVPKTEVAIAVICPDKFIVFYATPDAARDFADFGQIDPSNEGPDRYVLWVDSRYDFNEVVEYIRNY